MTDLSAIEAVGLTKSYGSTPVLQGVDLAVPRGSVFSLLGPNGAGKTTMVRILATLTAADAGHARVEGFDVSSQRHEVRRRISLTGQYAALDEAQTGTENLVMMGRLRRDSGRQARARAAELLEQFDLVEAAGRRVSTYSGGMRRRLDLAASLVGRPSVVFLDEPTTGLDPRSRVAMWDVVTELAASGVTVFLTTQYLDEADRLADRIAVVDGGRIVADGTVAELKRLVAGQRLDVVLTGAEAYDDAAIALGRRVVQGNRAELTLGVASDGDASGVRAVLDEIDPERTRVARFEVHAASLDDVFMTLTGRPTPSDDDPAEPADTAAGIDGADAVDPSPKESLHV